jgi:hypothetical protein
MAPGYVPYHQRIAPSSQPPDRNAPQWWHPLTNRWGIFGLIVFIGLVLRRIDGVAGWAVRQPSPLLAGDQSPASPVRTVDPTLPARYVNK